MRKSGRLATMVACGLAVAFTAGCTRIEAGYVGVKVDKFGDDRGVNIETLPPGVHVTGWNTDIHKFPTFTQSKIWDNKEPVNEEFMFQTKEGMSVSTDLGVSYYIPKEEASKVFQKYRKGVDEITNVVLRGVVRDTLNIEGSRVAVESAYGEGKGELQQRVQSMVQAQAKEFGVVVEKAYFVNEMRLPAEVIASINKKLAANQIAAQKQNELASAIADAEKVKAAAEGEKQAAILKAQGESEALRILGDALRQNPNVAELRAIEKWDGKLPQTMVPNASTPFVNLR